MNIILTDCCDNSWPIMVLARAKQATRTSTEESLEASLR
jgi:hypothetical protein